MKEVVARLQMGPAKYGRKFVRLNRTALNYTVQHGDLACLPWPQLTQTTAK